ncbi:hypothetical protein BDW71DRAFT_192595 [Aspergillus fruticulosus]
MFKMFSCISPTTEKARRRTPEADAFIPREVYLAHLSFTRQGHEMDRQAQLTSICSSNAPLRTILWN